MTTLGIYGYCSRNPSHGGTHNSGTALLDEQGNIIAAIEEERLSRVKMESTYPFRCIDYTMQGHASDIHQIGVARFPRLEMMSQVLENAAFWARHTDQFKQTLHFLNVMLSFPANAMAEKLSGKGAVPDHIADLPRQNVRHHHAHAASAYYCCPWPDEDVLVITLDGSGDAHCGSVWIGREGRMQHLLWIPSPHSVGNVYTAFTRHLGFLPTRHEGKVLGLAAYGDPGPFAALLLSHVTLEKDYPKFDTDLAQLVYQRFSPDVAARLAGTLKREEVAAGLQHFTEVVVLDFIRNWVAKTGIGKLAVAGGVFANVKLNQRIMHLDEVENLYIQPNMGDGGLSLGAAKVAHSEHSPAARPVFMHTAYLGPDISNAEAAQALEKAGLASEVFATTDQMAAGVADILAAGKVVARAAGRMEYGPRALGNRTLFASCSDPSINAWLNEKLKRTEFMPFAPIIMEEYAQDYFIGWKPEHVSARFMTITYDATDFAKQHIPAAIHVDGTARPQVLREEDNPEVYAILKAFHARTGIAALFNTSFNMHEEPIVCSAEDAVRAFQQGHLDALICANHLARANSSDEV